MRILHVTTEYPPLIYGGLGTAVGGLVRCSAHAGLEVAVLLVGEGSMPAYAMGKPRPLLGRHATTRTKYGVVVHTVSHAAAVSDGVAFAASWRPDVVHVHVFWLAHVAVALRQRLGVPLVYTVHSLDRAEYELGQGPPECVTQWPIQQDLLEIADRIVALTSDERDLIGQYCPRVRGRVHVVGNGIHDSPRARRCAERRSRTDTITILFSGRFVDRKGLRELLDATPWILGDAPGARLVMAGGYRHSSAAEMAAYWLPPACMPWRHRIFFTGWLTPAELNAWYAAADLLVVPSWYEPFGMVILEGMLFGLPIVASAVGGPREILIDGETGILCEPRNAASLHRAITRLVKDPNLRLRLGQSAARAVRSRWLYSHVVEKMRRVYDDATSIDLGLAV